MSSPNMSRLDRVVGGLMLTAALSLATATSVVAEDAPEFVPSVGPFEDVPTYRVNDERTHIWPGSVPIDEPRLVWSAKLADDEFHFNPLVLDGTLYVGDYEGVFHAVDAASGTELWSYATDDILEGATSADGIIAFVDGSGRLHALEAAGGAALWSLEGSFLSIHTAIEISDGILYVSSEDGILHGLDPKTGEETWSHQLTAPASSLTISEGIAYVGTTAGEVLALSLSDGSQLWRPVRLLSSRPSSMPLADGILYVGSLQPPGEPAGELLAIDATSGEVIWRFRGPSGRQFPPGAVSEGVIYVGSEGDGLYAFDAATGEVLWRVEDAPLAYTPVSLAQDTLIVPGTEGDLVAYDAADGSERWRAKAGVGTNVGPAISGGLIFQPDIQGMVFAFGDVALAKDAPVVAPDQPALAAGAPSGGAFAEVATWDASMIEGLDQPSGADMGPDGLFYVVNAGSSEIIVLDRDGTIVRRWGGAGTAEGQFDFARIPDDPFSDVGGVAVSPDGTVYVAESANRRVQAFTPEGEFVRQFGSYGSGDGQFLEPFDLDVGPDGSVYVVDDVRDDIQQFSAEGKYLRTIGRQGSGDGELLYTSSIVLADDGTLLNADWDNNRVQAWNADGEFLWTLGKRGTELGEFRYPADVAVDPEGNLFVSDFDNGRVQVFGPGNVPLDAWTAPLIEGFRVAAFLTYGGDGRLFVMNPFADLIHVIEYAGA